MNIEKAIAHALSYLAAWQETHEEAQKEQNMLERVDLLQKSGNLYHRYEGAKSTLIVLGVSKERFDKAEHEVFSK